MLVIAEGPVSPKEMLIGQRRELYHRRHETRELRRQADPRTQLPWVLLLDNEIMHLEVDCRRMELYETHLADLRDYDLPKPETRP